MTSRDLHGEVLDQRFQIVERGCPPLAQPCRIYTRRRQIYRGIFLHRKGSAGIPGGDARPCSRRLNGRKSVGGQSCRGVEQIIPHGSCPGGLRHRALQDTAARDRSPRLAESRRVPFIVQPIRDSLKCPAGLELGENDILRVGVGVSCSAPAYFNGTNASVRRYLEPCGPSRRVRRVNPKKGCAPDRIKTRHRSFLLILDSISPCAVRQ